MDKEISVNPSLEVEKLIRNISFLSWFTITVYAVLDYFNKSYLSSMFMGVGGCILFPLILFLNSQNKRKLARLLLLITLDACIFVAVTTTPFDDGGRFYFVPLSLMTLLLYELFEKKSLIFGMSLPVVTYFVSLHVKLPGYEVTADSGMAQDMAKQVNFIGVYLFTVAEMFFFVRHIRRLRIQAVEQSKFSALGIMSSGIAHEINNPLTVIKGRLFMLRKHIGEPQSEDITKDLEVISKTTDRIGKIVNGLRIFSRNADADPLSTIKSADIIQASLDLCGERFQKAGIKITIIDNGHFKMQGREAQLVQVIVNLLNNSYDAIQVYPEKWIRMEVSHNQIRVIDSGKGIPKKVAEKLMQPFYTTKEVGKGTGLGLSISKGIIDKHDGDFFLDVNHPNTCFVIRFRSQSTQSSA